MIKEEMTKVHEVA